MHFPQMHALHEQIKKKGLTYSPTDDEIAIANGTKMLSKEDLQLLSATSTNPLEAAFARQAEAKLVSYNPLYLRIC